MYTCIVRKLRRRGARLPAPEDAYELGVTALIWAAAKGHRGIVAALLAALHAAGENTHHGSIIKGISDRSLVLQRRRQQCLTIAAAVVACKRSCRSIGRRAKEPRR